MKHTPGPWEISVDTHGNLDICMTGAGDMIADLKDCLNAEANASLIAAAPELLEAAKDALQSLKRLSDAEGAYRITVIQELESAIGKAEKA